MRAIFVTIFAVFMSLSFVSIASADETQIEVTNAWARPVFMAGRTGAAYFMLKNNGAEDDRLLAVKTTLSERAELHEHIHDQGVMKMRQVDHVDAPAGKMVMFAPGGYHVMIFDVKEKLSEGDSFPLILTFEKAGDVEVTAHVMKQAPMQGHDHSGHH